MPTDERFARLSASFSGGEARQAREQQKVLQELERQAQRDALANGGLLLALFQALPAAALASERAEHERIVGRYGKDHPRAQALEASLDRLERTEARAALGRMRAARAMQTAQMQGAALQGFVIDAAGEPLRGMTVSVEAARMPAPLSARTAADGYFRIELPPAEAAPAREREEERELAQVVVLDANGRRVHEDPMPLSLRAGGAYREYTVEPEAGAPPRRPPRRGRGR
jgi:Carboxypeptidase regulatory-like domain